MASSSAGSAVPDGSQTPENCDFTVFGGTGDLAMRKLLPALYMCDLESRLPGGTRIIGISRSELSDDDYRAQIRDALAEHVEESQQNPEALERLLERVHHVKLDVTDEHDWHNLTGVLKDRENYAETARVFYLAVAPSLYAQISEQLGATGLAEAPARVVLEKPIGRDLASAREVNDAVGAVFDEQQIFRIDHYLGKESVQNLLVTRFANTFLEPLWTGQWIDHVQITVSEKLGVGDRGSYYDDAGALRDMVQNHLMQLLCLVAMEPPIEVGREDVRDEKLKVLHALKPMTPENVDRNVVRGRYKAGYLDGERITSYNDDLAADDIDTDGLTETFVALKTEVQNWRWSGVPFYLRTGKRMDDRLSEIVIVFKEEPIDVFRHHEGRTEPNKLTIRVSPDESMRLHLIGKEPGPGGYRLKPVSLDLNYDTTFASRSPDAYERLLMDVIRGIPTLFMRRDEVEAAWAWVEPILRHWADTGLEPRPYLAGTPGPSAAFTLIERDGRSWQEYL